MHKHQFINVYPCYIGVHNKYKINFNTFYNVWKPLYHLFVQKYIQIIILIKLNIDILIKVLYYKEKLLINI